MGRASATSLGSLSFLCFDRRFLFINNSNFPLLCAAVGGTGAQ